MNSKLFRGSLDSIILKLLEEHNELHGYVLSQMIAERSNGAFEITEGALYPALHRLEGKEVIKSETRKFQNRHRKYYRLTDKGMQVADQSFEEMRSYIKSLNLIFNPLA